MRNPIFTNRTFYYETGAQPNTEEGISLALDETTHRQREIVFRPQSVKHDTIVMTKQFPPFPR